jgi:hypothetical protein
MVSFTQMLSPHHPTSYRRNSRQGRSLSRYLRTLVDVRIALVTDAPQSVEQAKRIIDTLLGSPSNLGGIMALVEAGGEPVGFGKIRGNND